MQSTSFDLVIGSDLVYEEEGMRALVRGFDPSPYPNPNPNPSPNPDQVQMATLLTEKKIDAQKIAPNKSKVTENKG